MHSVIEQPNKKIAKCRNSQKLIDAKIKIIKFTIDGYEIKGIKILIICESVSFQITATKIINGYYLRVQCYDKLEKG